MSNFELTLASPTSTYEIFFFATLLGDLKPNRICFLEVDVTRAFGLVVG